MTAPLLVPWLLPPGCGALVGALIGWIVVPRFAAGALGRLASSGSETGQRLERTLADALRGLLCSRETIYVVRELVAGAVHSVASRPLAEIWKMVAVRELLSERLLPSLSADPRRSEISDSAGNLVAGQAGGALGDDVLARITAVVETAMPQAAEALLRWLESPDTREELAVRGRELLPRILEKLSDLQKLFLTAGQFDRRLDDKMPEIVDETVRVLRRMILDPRQQHRLLEVFSEAARGWRDTLLVTDVSPLGEESRARKTLADASSLLVDRLLATMDDPEQRRRVAADAASRLEADRRTLGAFAREVFGLREEEVAELVCVRVLGLVTAPASAQSLARGAVPALGRSLPSVARRLSRGADVRKMLAALGAGVGFAAGLVFAALRALGFA